jgi:hypothetical protein
LTWLRRYRREYFEQVACRSGRFFQVDSLAMAHLRNHSNYLLAGGTHNFGSAIAIIVRGLIANFAIVAPILLICSGLIVFLFDAENAYGLGLVSRYYLFAIVFPGAFSGTTELLIVGVGLFLLWCLYLSFQPARALSEASSTLPVAAAIYLAVVALLCFVEAQLVFIKLMLDFPEFANAVFVLNYQLVLVGIPFGIVYNKLSQPLRGGFKGCLLL